MVKFYKEKSVKELELILITSERLESYKKDMQEAFQYGYEIEYGKSEELILPEEDINQSLNTKNSFAYEAVIGNERVGGAVVNIGENNHSHLDFLFVKVGVQSRGIGKAIWKKLEEMHPQTEVWETMTPYFEKRNIHFYVNNCGFHIVEYFNKYHIDKNDKDTENTQNNKLFEEEGGMFRFEKDMGKAIRKIK